MVKTDRRLDMESPNYAKWIPEAGGYVHNGSKVSTTPLYDDAGNLKVDVDVSQLQISQPNKTQPQTTPGLQLNTKGSGVDVNAAVSGVGALASVASNKENSDFGVLNTPATASTSAKEPVLSPVDQTMKDIAYYQAHNNLQGMINGYTTLQQLTGQDYSQMINNLQQQRSQKIRNQDDAYLQQINQAKQYGDSTGDYSTYNQLVQEQQGWRDKVGYQDQITMDYNTKMQEMELDWQDAYISGINDVLNNVMSSISNLINFQYDPNTDSALQVAQGYAVGAVKEQMNHTGMYYSSMTQSAITRAVAELVPVYEKMARDELKENVSLLMNVGNFLMNIEKTQYDLWESQVKLQFEANNEKRKQVAQAIEAANARGYYNNEEAILLGVPAGTESANAQARAQEKQDEIEKELRQLQIKQAMADYEQQLALEKMNYENTLKEEYWAYQVNNPKPTTSSTGGTNQSRLGGTMKADTLAKFGKSLLSSGKSAEDVAQTMYDSAYSVEDYLYAVQQLENGEVKPTEKKHDLTLSQATTMYGDSIGNKKPSEVLDEIVEEYNGEDSNLSYILAEIKYPKSDESLLSGQRVFDKSLYDKLGKEAYKALLDFQYENENDSGSMSSDTSKLVDNLEAKRKSGQITNEEYNKAVSQFSDTIINEMISKNAKSYGSTASKTKEATDKSQGMIEAYATELAKSGSPNTDAQITNAYIKLIDSIANAGDTYDYSWLPFNEGKSGRTEAINEILTSVDQNDSFGLSKRRNIIASLTSYANNLYAQGLIDEPKISK